MPSNRMIAALAALTLQAATAAHAQSHPAAEFFRGKTVSILVGYEAGGGYDLYARVVAQFLGRHIPGQPTVIVQNMPGAGGLRAARNLANVAPGRYSARHARPDTAVRHRARLHPGHRRRRVPLDRPIAMNVEVGVAFARSGIARSKLRAPRNSVRRDRRHRELDSRAVSAQQARRHPLQAHRRLRSANEVLLAMERGEVEMVGATGISTIMAKHAARLKDGTVRLIYQSALTRHPDIPEVPTIGELGTGVEERQILDLFAAGSAIGRALIAPPGVPSERVAVLRQRAGRDAR